jgi:type 1 glutamine amidotransferase
MMKILFNLVVLASLSLSLSASAQTVVQEPRALVLIGDRYHNASYIRDGLKPAFAKANIAATFTEDVTDLSAKNLGKYQLFVMLREGRIWPEGDAKPPIHWMTNEQQKALWDFIAAGGGFLALHNSEALYPVPSDLSKVPYYSYVPMLGGEYVVHYEPYLFKIHVVNKNHPITVGVEDYEARDEQHFLKYSLDYLGPEHVLLRSVDSKGAGSPAGWWREISKGRLVYLAPGHTPEGLGNPMMQRLIVNSLGWLLKKS